MPRPRKVGLSYFPEDTNRRNDFKIMDLLNEYGPLGYTIYDFCLQYIYENGYYIDVPRHQLVLMLIKDIGAKWVKNKDLVGQVIDYCAEIGLFVPSPKKQTKNLGKKPNEKNDKYNIKLLNPTAFIPRFA